MEFISRKIINVAILQLWHASPSGQGAKFVFAASSHVDIIYLGGLDLRLRVSFGINVTARVSKLLVSN